jgi:hypothetical protein
MSGRRRRGKRSVGAGDAGFLLVVMLLALLSWPLALGPLVRLASTLSWQSSECTILTVEWRESTGGGKLRDRSRTLELRYSFEIDGLPGEGTAINASELDGGMRIREDTSRSNSESPTMTWEPPTRAGWNRNPRTARCWSAAFLCCRGC